jgi:outer membrane lipoprotein LolB
MRFRRFAAIALIAALPGACVAPPPRPPAAELEARWSAHAAALAPLSQWTLRGRLAVRTDDRGGQAALSWQREADRHAIRLNGPFGQGAVRITQDAAGARLVDAGAREFQAATAEELLYLYTGWQLPVAQLDWWVRGLPAPGAEAERGLDEAGRLRRLRQHGWEVYYESYRRVDGVDLPERLSFARPADADHPAMEARLVVERWAQVK